MKKLLTYFSLLLGTCLSTGCNTATSTDETIESSSSSSTAILISSSSAAALSKTTCLDQATGISCALEHFPDTLYYEYNGYGGSSVGTADSAHSTISVYLVDKEQGLFGRIINSHSEKYDNLYEHPDTTIVDTVIHDTVPRDSIAHLLYNAEDAIKLETVNFYELPDSLTAVYSSYDSYQGTAGGSSNAIYVDENGFLIYSSNYSRSNLEGSGGSYLSLNAWHAPLIDLIKP